MIQLGLENVRLLYNRPSSRPTCDTFFSCHLNMARSQHLLSPKNVCISLNKLSNFTIREEKMGVGIEMFVDIVCVGCHF